MLSVFILSACTTSIKNNPTFLVYEDIRQFQIDVTTEDDILSALGQPTQKSDEGGISTYIYDDSRTSGQRLSMTFQTAEKKLSSLLWIPYEGEKEASLNYLKNEFKKANFKEVPDIQRNPHAIISGAVSYIDEKLGITIRYDQKSQSVEAIALYSVKSRVPTDVNKRNDGPYTFGDETIISK